MWYLSLWHNCILTKTQVSGKCVSVESIQQAVVHTHPRVRYILQPDGTALPASDVLKNISVLPEKGDKKMNLKVCPCLAEFTNF